MLPAVVGGVFGLGLVACGFNVAVGGSTGGSFIRENHLKPIAIPAHACPYLDAVHVTSAAGQAFWDERDAFKNLGTPAADQRLDSVLAPFDFALRGTAPQVPARLRAELVAVAKQVEIGRALIAYRQAGSLAFFQSLTAGTMSLSHASDLVGHACGFPHAPDAWF